MERNGGDGVALIDQLLGAAGVFVGTFIIGALMFNEVRRRERLLVVLEVRAMLAKSGQSALGDSVVLAIGGPGARELLRRAGARH